MNGDPPPGEVVRACPNCETNLRIRWPPDNRAEIELRCYDCREWVTVAQ